jgi:RHS repeat-associated protein
MCSQTHGTTCHGELDTEFAPYYYRARYYDPQSGRFVGEDPLRFVAGTNFYSYVHNDASNLVDPGLCDDKNCKLSISCGPTPRTQGFSHCSVTVQNGSTYTAYDGGQPVDQGSYQPLFGERSRLRQAPEYHQAPAAL